MFSTPEFWVAVGFVILVAAIARPAGRGIGGSLDTRAERIRGTLDEAARLREEAQHMLAKYQRRQRDAAKEAEDMLAKAREEAERLTAEADGNLEQALKRREALAREKIALAEADALRAVRDTAIEIAIAATRKLIAEHLDEGRANVLIDDAIAELPKSLH